MVSWDVTIGGTTIQDIFEVNYSSGEPDKVGEVSILCANNATNRGISSGDDVTVKKNSTTDFTGYVAGKPTKGGPENVELEIIATDKRAELKYEQVKRVFYQKDTGDIIKEAINNRIAPASTENEEVGEFIHKGSSTSNWSTDIPIFELGDILTQSLFNAGDNFLFVGWSEGAGNQNYNLTYSNVPSSAIPGDGLIDNFKTRVLVNNPGGQFAMEVNLRDNSGNNYNWFIENPDSNFNLYELNAEDAVPEAEIGTSLSNDGYLEYRFRIDGELPEGRGAAIDFASTIPFRTVSRGSDISPSQVETTGNVITRRVDRSIFEMLREFGIEDGYISYVDESDILHYEQAGQTQSPKDIDFDTTNVTKADFNRDFENVINKVTVVGDGDIKVTVEDPASIKFYGVSAREEPIVDEQIQTKNEAIRRGKGMLRKKAWDDSAFVFEVADASYQDVQIGDDITVDWPPESINGTYSVTKLDTDFHGIVTLHLTGADTV